MSDLNIKQLSISEAEYLDNFDYDITLKRDGTLIYYIDGKLFSPRCERTERFKHIVEILRQDNFPNCMGEMFIDEPKANVFDVSRSENWNKAKFMPFDLIDSKNNPSIYNMSYKTRQERLAENVRCLNNEFIVPLMKFNSFKEGWDYVVKNECEGLVLRNSHNWFKVKILKEAKVEIKEHEKGKDKGTFILIDGNRISGTSMEYVLQFVKMKESNRTPMLEIEYPFKTESGKYFQPRARRIFAKEDEM